MIRFDLIYLFWAYNEKKIIIDNLKFNPNSILSFQLLFIFGQQQRERERERKWKL